MSVYPKWMGKRNRQITVEIPVPDYSSGGGSGGGVSIVRVQQPIPTVKIKKVVVLDDYENINITVLQVIDLSLNGGT